MDTRYKIPTGLHPAPLFIESKSYKKIAKTNKNNLMKSGFFIKSGGFYPAPLSRESGAGFTLIELLIVVGILATIATASVLILNPAQMMAQSRDSTRLNDLQTLNKAINLSKVMGSFVDNTEIQKVYVSLADTSVPLDGFCDEYTLPSLASGWEYRCAAPNSTLRKVDGTGWLPINFASVASIQPPLAVLPIDPSNNPATLNYYIYVRDTDPNVYALTAKLDSDKYLRDSAAKDGGADDVRYEVSQSSSLWANASGLAGLWRMDEASWNNNCSTLTVMDSSPNANHGKSCPNGTGPLGGAVGKVGNAGSFDGSDDYTQTTNTFSINTANSSYTVSAWIYQTATGGYSWNSVAGVNIDGASFGLMTQSGNKIGAWACGYHGNGPNVGNFQNSWHFITAIYTQNTIGFTPVKMYFDGNYIGNSVLDRTTPCSLTSTFQIAKSYSGYNTWFGGSVDEVRIYNRALSATEILTIYNATK